MDQIIFLNPIQARIIIVRLQDEPDDNFQPPRFGDLVIIWNPKRDGGDATFEERSQANPIVVTVLSWCHPATVTKLQVGNLLNFLEQKNVLEKFNYRRDADSTEQGSGQHLDYDSGKLFVKRCCSSHAARCSFPQTFPEGNYIVTVPMGIVWRQYIVLLGKNTVSAPRIQAVLLLPQNPETYIVETSD